MYTLRRTQSSGLTLFGHRLLKMVYRFGPGRSSTLRSAGGGCRWIEFALAVAFRLLVKRLTAVTHHPFSLCGPDADTMGQHYLFVAAYLITHALLEWLLILLLGLFHYVPISLVLSCYCHYILWFSDCYCNIVSTLPLSESNHAALSLPPPRMYNANPTQTT